MVYVTQIILGKKRLAEGNMIESNSSLFGLDNQTK